jgi:hypothetical protein
MAKRAKCQKTPAIALVVIAGPMDMAQRKTRGSGGGYWH